MHYLYAYAITFLCVYFNKQSSETIVYDYVKILQEIY